MVLDLFFLLSGLAIIAKFSSIVVDAATKLSQITGISKTAIGFIVIGVGTSLPELSIGLISSLENHGELSVGNLLGANITNLTLILGFMAFIGFNLGKIYSQQLKRAIAITAGIAVILVSLGTAGFLFGLFLLSIYYMFSMSVMRKGIIIGENVDTFVAAKAALKLLISVAIVVMSAYVTTNSAISLAAVLGMSNTIIGATIISIGTTMPELSVNLAAVRKRNLSLAIGDFIGTITSNLALILGIVTIINPVHMSADILLLASLFLATSMLVYVLASRLSFGLKESLLLTAIYVIYLLSLFIIGVV